MKYRKKPVVIEAIKFDGKDLLSLLGFVKEGSVIMKSGAVFIRTLEGDMRVGDGDFIIRGVNGEYYPCKAEIFEKTYEVAEDDRQR